MPAKAPSLNPTFLADIVSNIHFLFHIIFLDYTLSDAIGAGQSPFSRFSPLAGALIHFHRILQARPFTTVWHSFTNEQKFLGTQAFFHALDALFAGFPAGTVSGAPKVRACEIIAELEPATRGPYAGGVGYFAPDGSLDSCIVLRTAVIKDGTMHVQAGAGIVADSDAAKEYEETLNKARALLRAVSMVDGGGGAAG